MFGHLKLQYGQIKHLTALNHAGKGQFLLARLALVGDAVDNGFFGLDGSTQVLPA